MTGQRQRNGATIAKTDQDPKAAQLLTLGLKEGQPGAERRTSARWTNEEEAKLRSAVGELGKGKWTLVADRLGTGRSPSAVEQHWQIVTGQRKSKGRHAQAHAAAQAGRLADATAPPQAYAALGGVARPGAARRRGGGPRGGGGFFSSTKKSVDRIGGGVPGL